ncbi:MAG: hypothetical protein JAY75_23490 [Candidatus Thiodiazotropha taylori]|nr:hypothetical protein [Candidatus Thiodiazotropha taylori]MCW4311173.1 hypothetical protein [Candidatus Thiodiazotropha endolucinida]
MSIIQTQVVQDINSLFFKHPANIFISGPSGSGKTEFVRKVIEYKHDLFDIQPQRIVWCYKEWQPAYNILQEREGSNITFLSGIPNDDDDIVTDTSLSHLIVFDDMLGDKDEEKIKLWFTRKGHHRNASVIYITQNLFQQSKDSRTISLNAHYLILFQSPRDKMQIKHLAKQLQSPHLMYAFNDATSKPHGYLLIDLKPDTPDMLRFRTNIFQNWFTKPGHQGPVIYFPNI